VVRFVNSRSVAAAGWGLSDVTPATIAARAIWLVVFSFGALALDANSDRLFGLFSFGSLFVGLAVVASAVKTGSERPTSVGRRVPAGFGSAREPIARDGWSWMRLAYAFEVLSVGLLIWLAAALVVGGIAYLASGDAVSWTAGLLVVGITSPVAVPWPVARWPPPMASAFTGVPALIKKRLVVSIFSTPSVLVLAVTIDRLVSGFSTLSLARQVGGIGVIVLVVASAAWLGSHLQPLASSTGRGLGLMDLRRKVDPVGQYGDDHPYARAVALFEVACAGVVILLTTLALAKLIDGSIQDEEEAFFVVTTFRATGGLAVVVWLTWRVPIANPPS